MKDPGRTPRLLARTQHRLRPDASRTLCRLFVPGQETLIRGESRAMVVINRVLDMTEQEVDRALARTLARFSGRHRDLGETLEPTSVSSPIGSAARSGWGVHGGS